jgi:hypothetical protein
LFPASINWHESPPWGRLLISLAKIIQGCESALGVLSISDKEKDFITLVPQTYVIKAFVLHH